MQTVYDYIKKEENSYQVLPVPVVEGYEWNMFEHVKLTTLYLNSQFKTGKEDNKPFRNIILPKVNLEHRAVQFNINEINFYINSSENYKSFLVKKFHERWAMQNDIADFLDELSETWTDYGGVLVKNTKDTLEVVPFQRLAFVDQTDMMSGPICEKHQYSPDQLKDMADKGWKNVDEVITLASDTKANTQTQTGTTTQLPARTPGRYIEVYELHGMLPETFLDPEGDPNKFVRQMQIVTFYVDKTSQDKKGITLYAGKESKPIYKAYKRDKIYGRALGRGAVEELFEPQVWVNDAEIARTEMLQQLSKVIYQTADQSFRARNTISELENGDVLTYADGKPLAPLNNTTVNLTAFENAMASWNNQGQEIAAATDPIAGEQPKSNTTGEANVLQNEESHSLHEYRKGRLSTFLVEIYRDWVLTKVKKAVLGGEEFLSDLSSDEMGQLVDQVVACEFNKTMIAKVLSGQIVYPEDTTALQNEYRQQFFKTGNRKLVTILAGELDELPLEVEVNITSKQRNMQYMAQKVSALFTQASQLLIVNPNFFTQNPEMAKLFNEIIEAYGLSTLTFGMNGTQTPNQPNPQPNAQPQPQPAQVPAQPQAG